MNKQAITVSAITGRTRHESLGWVTMDRLDDDMEFERQRYSKLALRPGSSILIVTATDNNIVVLHKDGEVKIISYLRVMEKPWTKVGREWQATGISGTLYRLEPRERENGLGGIWGWEIIADGRLAFRVGRPDPEYAMQRAEDYELTEAKAH